MADTAARSTKERARSARGREYMVATGNGDAARAAHRMLLAGGSAIDAAIAADAVMGVVEPMATSIGGDLLAMICTPDGEVESYNGTGRAPAAFEVSALESLPGRRIPERHPWSVTTPGAVRGWQDLHRRYGRLDWAMLFEPAIRLARHGYEIAAVSAREWRLFDSVLHVDPACARLYRAGRPPEAGELIENRELADVLEMIAREGADAFYQGWIPQAASDAVKAMGGYLEPTDFHEHTGNYCAPVSTDFHGARVYQCPPNTHGIAILHALEAIEANAGDPADPATWVHLVQSTAKAMQYAARTVADPAGNTVCTVVADANGLAVTLMSSIFKRFGSGIAVPGGGFVLQNRGFGFATPGHINGPAPRKRPYHTVVPGITTRNGRFHLGMGVVGGLMQPQGQIQILARTLGWNSPLRAALDAPRLRLEAGDTLAIEDGTPPEISQALRDAGFPAPQKGAGELGGRSDFGGAHAIMRHDDGTLEGAADARKDGACVGH